MEKVIEDPEITAAVEPLLKGGKAIQPAVDIVDDHGNLILYLDLPGVGPGQAQVELDADRILSIRAKGALAEPGSELLRQFPIGDYYRAFQLGSGFDRDRIKAEMSEGTLVLTLPKLEQDKPKVIPISA